MFKTVATLLMMVAATEAKKCKASKLSCNAGFIKDLDACKCDCVLECDAATEVLVSTEDVCACELKPCEPCAPGEGGSATAADFQQAAAPDCGCTAAADQDPCDAKYGGLFEQNAAGEACPKDAAGGDEEGGESGEGGEGEGSGAATIAAAGLTVLTALLI